jgi:hypothetical protein
MFIDRSADEFKALYERQAQATTLSGLIDNLNAQYRAWTRWRAGVAEVNRLARGWATA